MRTRFEKFLWQSAMFPSTEDGSDDLRELEVRSSKLFAFSKTRCCQTLTTVDSWPYFHAVWLQRETVCTVSEGSTYLRAVAFRCCDLDINPMTLKLEGDLDILKMYLHTENEVARKLLTVEWYMYGKWKKYENSSQGQRWRSNVTNFQSLLALTMAHIPTKLYRFLTSSSQQARA